MFTMSMVMLGDFTLLLLGFHIQGSQYGGEPPLRILLSGYLDFSADFSFSFCFYLRLLGRTGGELRARV